MRSTPAGKLALLLTLLATLTGCPDDEPPYTLNVDLKTDYVPGEEFFVVTLQIGDGDLALRSDRRTQTADDYLRGQRIDSESVAPGNVPVTVSLFDGSRMVAQRRAVVLISATTTVATILITRDCEGAMCPTASERTLNECLGGRCVDPRCTLETPEFCPAPMCVEASDCQTVPCAEPRCEAGVCFVVPDNSRCGPAQRCDGLLGCVDDVPVMDGGVDAATPDAGPDGGPDTGPGAPDADPEPDASAPMPPPGMIYIPVDGTPFDFAPGDLAGDPWKVVTLTRAFFMDRHEVTVERFRTWVDAGMPVPCTVATADGDGTCALNAPGVYDDMRWDTDWNGQTQGSDFGVSCASPWSPGFEDTTYSLGDTLPMNCVSWFQAIAFCAFDGGKRLPTQVEWNYEARGGTQRTYVWGEDPLDCTRATHMDGAASYCGFPVPVGMASAGASVHGAMDMAGSLWEWTWDGTSAAEFVSSAQDVPAGSVNFAGVDSPRRVIAGGEWGLGDGEIRLVGGSGRAGGEGYRRTRRVTTVGFRCVQSVI